MTETNEAKIEEAKNEEATGATRGLSIRIIGAVAIIVAILLAFFAFAMAGYVADERDVVEADEAYFIECSKAVDNLQTASDFLTTQARMFVTTGRASCMYTYIEELDVTNRRGSAVDQLHAMFPDGEDSVTELEQALAASDELAQKELTAIRLAADAYGIDSLPTKIANVTLDENMAGLGNEAKLEAARDLVLGTEYDNVKATIRDNVEASSNALLALLNDEISASNTRMQNLLFQLRIAVALLLCVVMILVLVLFMYVLKPLGRYIKRIEKNEPLEADGSYELQYLARAYNTMYEDNNKRIEQLRQVAERDALTGISNRSGYDSFLAKHTRNIALILIDIDNFKEFNKVYGRDTGDAVLIKLANALSTAFRSTDFPCRLQSDRFAIVMTNMNADLHDAVTSKINLVNSILADDSDSLPLITLSVGAAFSVEGMSDNEIYEAAESALHHVQENGRNGLAFYGEVS